jgi:4-diphosphocytidyl-2-C-methyl-D-erythritol kinase
MVVFPNCKINLGLHVLSRRPDGFHEIESIMYPVGWCDALEAVHDPTLAESRFTTSGIESGSPDENLVWRAYQLLSETRRLPAARIHLHKNIPSGAGLGGGSSDAAFALKLLNDVYTLNISADELREKAALLGSDCAFFIDNQPSQATGRGEKLKKVQVDLSASYILVAHPGVHSSTSDAYRGVRPRERSGSLAELVKQPLKNWKDTVFNDFETSVFQKYPVIRQLKEEMYAKGAVYSAMSGSGSAVFGIFESRPDIVFNGSAIFLQEPRRAAI